MNSSENTSRRPQDDRLEELLRQAAPRTRPPAGAERAARAALHAQWRDLTAQRRRRRYYAPVAAAALVVIALGAAALILRAPAPAPAPVTVATVEVVVGTVLQQAAGEAATAPLAVAGPLQTDTQITAGTASGLALRWRDGSSVRLDENSGVRLTRAGEVRLDSGRLYVDAGEAVAAAPLVVLTPAGRVRHLGTQYMTAVSGAGTTVSVRSGRVRLDGPGAPAEADAGEQLQVDPSGTSRRRAIPTYGDLWQWTQVAAPGFAADGRSVAEFLDWVSRESGRSITFVSPEAERLARQTRLRGRIEMEPMAALAAILQSSDLAYEADDGTLRIRMPTDH